MSWSPAMSPAVLAAENELVSAGVLPDCFRLEWSPGSIDAEGVLPAITLHCAIQYESAGTAFHSGMDRGRSLAAMDGELLAALNQSPQTAIKTNYAPLANGEAAAAMGTSIWWGALSLGKTTVRGDRLARTASVDVMAYQEAGEL